MGVHTDDEKLKLRAAMWASGMSIGEIAERCGVSYNAIENYARKHRDMFPKRTKPSKATLVNQMWAMYGDGLPVWKIAKTLGRPVREVEEWLAEE